MTERLVPPISTLSLCNKSEVAQAILAERIEENGIPVNNHVTNQEKDFLGSIAARTFVIRIR